MNGANGGGLKEVNSPSLSEALSLSLSKDAKKRAFPRIRIVGGEILLAGEGRGNFKSVDCDLDSRDSSTHIPPRF